MTYHGRIVNPDGTALQGTVVQFQMQIRSPGNENCLLYQEVQTLNMQGTNGVFSISINDGAGTRTDSNGWQFDTVFSNSNSFTPTSGSCGAGGSYTPNYSDGRNFVVSFRSENMSAYETLPAQAINFSPIAIQAKYIDGFGPNNLLRVDNTAANNNLTPLNSAQLTSLQNLINGTSTQYLQGSTTSGAVLPVVSGIPVAPSTGSVWFNSATGSLQYYNGTSAQTVGSGSGSGTVTSIATGTGLTGGPITTSGTIGLSNFGTAGSYYKVTTDATGRVSSGSAALVETDIPSLVTPGHVSGSAINAGTIGGSTSISTTGTVSTAGLSTDTVKIYEPTNTYATTLNVPNSLAANLNFTLPSTAGSANQVLSTDGSGVTSWITPSAGTVTSVTAGMGLTGGTITSNGTIALATSGVTASTYKSVTVDTYGRVTAGSNPTTLSGFGITDAVQNAGGTPSVQTGLDAAKPPAATAGRVYVATDTQKIYSDSGSAWTVVGSNSGAGGTVTSVALSAPSIFTVSGSPVTTAGTLGLSLTSETAHQVLAAPQGANGAPSFRNFNISDLMSSVSGGFLTGSSCTSGQALVYSSITDTIVCSTLSLSSSQVTTALGFTPVKNNGSATSVQEGLYSALPAAGNVGAIYVATDTKSIYRDNGTNWDLLSNGAAVSSQWTTNGSNIGYTAGNVGIGTTSPAAALQVIGQIRASSGLSSGSNTVGIAPGALELRSAGGVAPYIEFAEDGVAYRGQVGFPAGSADMVFQTGGAGFTGGSERMRITGANGNVGVGITTPQSKLDVNGSVRVGADATSCSSTIQGAIHLNGTALEYCNGTAWTALGTSSATGTVTSIAAGIGLTGGTITTSGTIALATVGSAGTYQSVTVDAYGRITAGTNPTTLAGYGINDAVKNGGGTPSVQTGADASKPTAGTAGRVYVATDTQKIYSDSGSAWTVVGSNAGTGISALTGDVTASGSGSVAATVATVGGSTAANVHTAELAANAATSLNTVSTIMKRDASGNFMAGTATLASVSVGQATGLVYNDTGTKSVAITAPTTVSTSYVLKLPTAVAAAAGQVLSSDTSGNLSWTTPSTVATSYNGTLPVANGGTNSATALNNNRIIVSSGGAIVESAALINGQILIGSTGAAPVAASLTAGTGITITPAAGSITIATSGAAPTGSASGDLSGSYPGPTVARIQGTVVSATAPTLAGQMLRYDGSTWTPNFVAMTDLRSTITGTNQFTSTCTNSQTLTYNSVGDVMSCTNISVAGSNFASQTANTFLAAPNGFAGAPTFRGIAAADLPSITSGLTGVLPVANGGTGVASPTAHGVLIGEGASAVTAAVGSAGTIHQGMGSSADPSWTAGPTLGVNATTTGQLLLANGNTSGTSVTVQNNSATTAYNFNLPATAGTSGYVLTSAGGAAAPMTWTPVAPASGSSSITTLGTVTTGTWNASTITVPYGGTGATMLTSHGVLLGEGTSAISATASGAAGNILTSGGASADPTWGAINLAGGANSLSGILPIGNGGTGAATLTGAGIFANGGNSFGAAASIGTNDSNNLTLKTNNAAAMTLLASGNVGIGTISPNKILEVQKVDASAPGLGNGAAAIRIVNNTAVSNSLTELQFGNNQVPNSLYAAISGIYLNGGSNTQGDLAFSTRNIAADANLTERMRIMSNGNVGVGTTSPNAALTIGTALAGSALSTTLITNAGLLSSTAGTDLSLANIGFTSVNNTSLGIHAYRTAAGSDWSTTALGLGMDVDNSTRAGGNIWLNANGNVGVGIASPTNSLDIGSGVIPSGNGNFVSTSNSAGKSGYLFGQDSTDYATLKWNYNSTPANATIYFGDVSGTHNMAIQMNGGNVGIGLTSPKSALDVAGSVKVGADATACSATIQGAIHLNGTALEYCNATAWIALGSASGGAYLSSSGGTVAGAVTVSSGGETISAGGLSVTGGINDNSGAITNAGNISGNGSLSLTPANTATSGTSYINSFLATYNPASAPAASTTIWGTSNQVTTGGSSSLANATVVGGFNSIVHNAATTLNNGEGAFNQAYNGSSGTITNAYGSIGRANNASTGTITNAYGSYADVVNGSGTVSNGYGMYTGIIDATNKFSFYAADPTAPSYFAANVGIGTTAPTSPLDTVGVANFRDSGIAADNGYNGAIRITRAVAANQYINFTRAGNYVESLGYMSGASVFGFGGGQPTDTNFGPNHLSINIANGNVGIGTTSPGYNLSVASSTTPQMALTSTGTSGRTFSLQSTGGTGTALDGDFQLIDRTANAARMTLDGSGNFNFLSNVGIGTTTPINPLTVGSGTNAISMGIAGSCGIPGIEFGSSVASCNTYAAMMVDTSNDFVFNVPTGSTYGFRINNTLPEALKISSTGNVGIGITNPSYTLHVVGTAGLSTGTAWTNASDIRLKDLHGDYEYGLDEVLKLHTVRFTYKKDNPLGLPSDHPMTGFIAQEVEKVIPDAVHENKNGYLELNVDPIHWAVVNAVKELKKLIDGIYERLSGHDQAIADQARDIASVKAESVAKDQKIKQLEQENAAIKAYLCGKDPSAAICQ